MHFMEYCGRRFDLLCHPYCQTFGFQLNGSSAAAGLTHCSHHNKSFNVSITFKNVLYVSP